MMALRRVRHSLGRDGLSVVVLALWAVALAVSLPSLLIQDSWLDLVDGRLIAQHGLPHVDTQTLWTLGRHWTDQQWGAHLALYELVRAGGLRAALGFDIVCVLVSVAILAVAGRRLGGSPRSTAIALCLPLLATPWLAQLRAQTFALVLFAGVFVLLVQDGRAPSRRVLLVLPLLAVWANLHGSVALGAALVAIRGLMLASSRQSRVRGLALVIGSPLCLLVSPYGFRLVAYYRLMLLDPPLAHYVSEWKPPALVASNAIFFLSAVAVIGLWAVRGRALTPFERLALPLLAVAAFTAARNTIWFELAALVALPRLLDARSELRAEPASIERANTILALVGAAAAVAVCSLQLAGAQSRIDNGRPPSGAAAAAAAAGPHGIVLADDDNADWLLWLEPSLAGRVAYDVRFELFSSRELRQIQLLHSNARPVWRRCGSIARVVTFATPAAEQAARQAGVLAPGSRTIVDTPNFVAVVQPGATNTGCKL
jgi:hypothetical protein